MRCEKNKQRKQIYLCIIIVTRLTLRLDEAKESTQTFLLFQHNLVSPMGVGYGITITLTQTYLL